MFVDISGSMQGFFGAIKGRKDSARTVAAVYEELDAAFAALQLGTPEKCSVGASASCGGFPSSPVEVAAPRLYRESASRLDKVLTREALPPRIDPNNPPPPDLLDDARLTVLVTDGMQASKTTGSVDGACADGADPTCIASLLGRRADEGFGIWFVAILLPFNGRHFPERILTQAYFEQTQKHIGVPKKPGEVSFDIRNSRVDFQVRGGLLNAAGESSFAFQGYKPLLLVVVSRTDSLGRAFVRTLSEKLMAAPLRPGKMKPEDCVKTLELAPLDTGLRATAITNLPNQVQIAAGITREQLAEFHLQGSHLSETLVSSLMRCGANGAGLVAIEHESPGSSLLPPFAREEIDLVALGAVPAGAISPAVPMGQNRIRTGINCARLAKGTNDFAFSFQSRLVIDEATARKEWWGNDSWSATNTWEMPERLYGLEDVVLGVFNAKAKQSRQRSEVRVHVQRE